VARTVKKRHGEKIVNYANFYVQNPSNCRKNEKIICGQTVYLDKPMKKDYALCVILETFQLY
jgi:hypothetical protein